MTDPNITRASTVLVPVVWALRCRCGAEVQGEHVLRRRPTPDELRVAERMAKRDACIEADRLGWAVAPHGYELDLCPRCRP